MAKRGDGNGRILQPNNFFDLTGDLEMHARYLEACYGYGMMHGQFNDSFGLELNISGHNQLVFLPMNPNAPIMELVPPVVTVSESTREIVQAQEMNTAYTYNSPGVHSFKFISSLFLPSFEFEPIQKL